MAAHCRLRGSLALLLCCSAVAVTRAQTSWPPPTIAAVDPTTASTEISRQFLSDEQHQLLTSPSFGQRLTTRPRTAAARPATRRDWTPIWPGSQAANGGAAGTTAAGTSRRPDTGTPPSLAPSRPPVTEYYFASSATPAAAAVGGPGTGGDPTFPSAQLPTATFAAPAASPTRTLPPASSRRPAVTRVGLADRLSALVTSRPARTTVISPTRASPVPPSSAALRPAPEVTAGGGPGLEPSTRPPWVPERTVPTSEPTATAPRPGASPAAAGASDGEVSPTPVSPPCVVTPQHPGGYCRNGDILTVFTRDAAGNWEAYRTVQLPSSTVAALDGQSGEEETTQDPLGVTAAPADRPADQSTPAEDGGATVTSPPLEPAPTAAAVVPISEPAEEAEAATEPAAADGSGARDHLPSAGPPLPSAGPTLPSAAGPTLPGSFGSGEQSTQPTPEEGAVVFPTATSAVPGPQPPTVGPRAGAGAASTATVPPTTSELEKSGFSERPAEPEVDKVTTLPPTRSTARQTTRWRTFPTTQPPTWPPTQPPTRETTRGTTWETTRQATRQTTQQTTRQTTQQAVQEDTEPSTVEETFPTTPEMLSTTAFQAETTPGLPSPTTPPPTWPPTNPTAGETLAPTDRTAETPPPPSGPLWTGSESTETGEDWGTATSAAPPETTWHTLPAGAHPETTQQTSSKSAELGKVSVTDPLPTRAPNGSWTGSGTTDDGFSTGTYHFSTTGAFDYPTGPTAFTSRPGGGGGVTRRPSGHHTSFATGSSGFPSTTASTSSAGVFRPTAPSAPTDLGDYDYNTAPSGANGNGFHGGGLPYGEGNYTTIGHGRLTPPPPPSPGRTTTIHSGTTDFTTPLGTNRPTETSFTSTRHPETTVGTTADTTPGTTTPGTTTPGTKPPPGITHSSVVPPVELYVQFLIGTTWPRFCRMRQAFKQRVVDLVNADSHSNLTADSAVLFNIPICGRPVRARREAEPASSVILVFLYLNNAAGQYDRQLTERVEPLWEAAAASPSVSAVGGDGGGGGMARLVREVNTVRPQQLVQPEEHSERAGLIAAITVGCVAVASLVLLAVLLVVVRHRRRAAQTAQRCNPVNLEEYGVESVFSSMRRKNKLRRSVRSYLNQAFDDHDAPSNAVNFAGLANLSGDLAALKEEFDSIPTGAMPTLDDLPPGSEDRNRYANVLPVPETRVVLEQKTGAPNSDYINANYVRGPKDEPQFYIATQGPLESTVNDFWRMIWETQSKVVICLTDIVERGVRRCAEYLPPSEALDRHRLYGDFQVTLMAKTKKDKFVVSTIQLKNMDSNLFREVTHLWYSGWPERGVPSDLDSLVEFLQESRRAMKTNIGPTVVHCSPGTGRTGVLLACDICMRQFDGSRTADIMRTVFRIRQDRAGAVQTREQYALIYKVLNQYAASVTSGNLPALE